jgi:hypothetical protein
LQLRDRANGAAGGSYTGFIRMQPLPVQDIAIDVADLVTAHAAALGAAVLVPSLAAVAVAAADDANRGAPDTNGVIATSRPLYGVRMSVIVLDEVAPPAAHIATTQQAADEGYGIRIGLVSHEAKPTDATIEAAGGFAITIFPDRPGLIGANLTALQPPPAPTPPALSLSASDVTALAVAGAASGHSVDATCVVPPQVEQGGAVAIGLDRDAGTCRLAFYSADAVRSGFHVDARSGEGPGKATARMELRLDATLVQSLTTPQVPAYVAIQASHWQRARIL